MSKNLTLSAKLALAKKDTPQDHQVASYGNMTVLEEGEENFIEKFKETFPDLCDDPKKIEAATTLRNSIKRGLNKTLDAYIEIGNALIYSKKNFTTNEYEKLLRAESLIGIKYSKACMLRKIATDIGSRRIPREVCPESYAAAYAAATLPDHALSKAIETQIIHPNATRKQIVEFREEVLPKALVADQRKSALEAQLKKIRSQLNALTQKEQGILSQLAGL